MCIILSFAVYILAKIRYIVNVLIFTNVDSVFCVFYSLWGLKKT